MTKAESNNMVVTDYELENNEHPLGKLVHVSTVTHAFQGILEAVTCSYFILKDAALIPSTGDLSQYGKSKKAAESEKVGTEVRVPRGAVAWLMVWP